MIDPPGKFQGVPRFSRPWRTHRLTSSSSEHDEQHRVEEAERHREDVLVNKRRQQEHQRHRQRTLPLTQQLHRHNRPHNQSHHSFPFV